MAWRENPVSQRIYKWEDGREMAGEMENVAEAPDRPAADPAAKRRKRLARADWVRSFRASPTSDLVLVPLRFFEFFRRPAAENPQPVLMGRSGKTPRPSPELSGAPKPAIY
jgi:hypothetical protein